MGKVAEEITSGNKRVIQKRTGRANAFTPVKQRKFFRALADTANVAKSVKKAGVCSGTVYNWRRKILEFRTRWDETLHDGYAALEAGLLESARLAIGELKPEASDGPSVGAMDAKLAFAMLQRHDANRGRPHGAETSRRGDSDVVIERLEKALKRFAPDVAEQPAEAGK